MKYQYLFAFYVRYGIAQWFEAMRYKPEGSAFYSRWCQCAYVISKQSSGKHKLIDKLIVSPDTSTIRAELC